MKSNDDISQQCNFDLVQLIFWKILSLAYFTETVIEKVQYK